MTTSPQGSPIALSATAVFRKIARRLIPYLFLLYILAYLDRVNVGFAALDMQRDLHLSDTVYGTGAGLFFLGSALFDLPSNLLLGRFGARRWIARIMIGWGIVATSMMFMRGAHSFYLLRFLLGVGEAGFFPGMILYLTYWFPSHERAKRIAQFMTATSLAGVVGAPLSAALLGFEGRAGLHGWQWLFLVEGTSTLVLGVSVLFLLRDKPDDAPWLSPGEKEWLDAELARDRQQAGASGHSALKDAFRMPLVWLLASIYIVDQIGVYTVNLWMPLILHSHISAAATSTGSSAGHIANFTAIPYLAAAICTVLVGWSSDRMGERRLHIVVCLLLSVVGFSWAAVASSFGTTLCAMTLATVGYWSPLGAFWALLTRTLTGRAAAGAVALITIVGGIGGFFGPYLTGRLKDLTHGFSGGLWTIAGLTFGAALLCLALPASQRRMQP